MPPKATRTYQPFFTASDVSRLATAYGKGKDEIEKLLKAPTARLARQFMAAALTKAQLCDKLEAENGTTKDKRPFPFMDLPPELRLRIYELVMGGILEQTPPEGFAPRQGEGRSLGDIAAHHLMMANEVIHTSRMSRLEALPVFIKVADDMMKAARKQAMATQPPDATTSKRHSQMFGHRRELKRVRDVLRRNEQLWDHFRELKSLHDVLSRNEARWMTMFRKEALFARYLKG